MLDKEVVVELEEVGASLAPDLFSKRRADFVTAGQTPYHLEVRRPSIRAGTRERQRVPRSGVAPSCESSSKLAVSNR